MKRVALLGIGLGGAAGLVLMSVLVAGGAAIAWNVIRADTPAATDVAAVSPAETPTPVTVAEPTPVTSGVSREPAPAPVSPLSSKELKVKFRVDPFRRSDWIEEQAKERLLAEAKATGFSGINNVFVKADRGVAQTIVVTATADGAR